MSIGLKILPQYPYKEEESKNEKTNITNNVNPCVCVYYKCQNR
jgi:hypothetical protein